MIDNKIKFYLFKVAAQQGGFYPVFGPGEQMGYFSGPQEGVSQSNLKDKAWNDVSGMKGFTPIDNANLGRGANQMWQKGISGNLNENQMGRLGTKMQGLVNPAPAATTPGPGSTPTPSAGGENTGVTAPQQTGPAVWPGPGPEPAPGTPEFYKADGTTPWYEPDIPPGEGSVPTDAGGVNTGGATTPLNEGESLDLIRPGTLKPGETIDDPLAGFPSSPPRPFGARKLPSGQVAIDPGQGNQFDGLPGSRVIDGLGPAGPSSGSTPPAAGVTVGGQVKMNNYRLRDYNGERYIKEAGASEWVKLANTVTPPASAGPNIGAVNRVGNNQPSWISSGASSITPSQTTGGQSTPGSPALAPGKKPGDDAPAWDKGLVFDEDDDSIPVGPEVFNAPFPNSPAIKGPLTPGHGPQLKPGESLQALNPRTGKPLGDRSGFDFDPSNFAPPPGPGSTPAPMAPQQPAVVNSEGNATKSGFVTSYGDN